MSNILKIIILVKISLITICSYGATGYGPVRRADQRMFFDDLERRKEQLLSDARKFGFELINPGPGLPLQGEKFRPAGRILLVELSESPVPLSNGTIFDPKLQRIRKAEIFEYVETQFANGTGIAFCYNNDWVPYLINFHYGDLRCFKTSEFFNIEIIKLSQTRSIQELEAIQQRIRGLENLVQIKRDGLFAAQIAQEEERQQQAAAVMAADQKNINRTCLQIGFLGVSFPLAIRLGLPTFSQQAQQTLLKNLGPAVGIGFISAAFASSILQNNLDPHRIYLRKFMAWGAIIGAGTACAATSFTQAAKFSSLALNVLIGAHVGTAVAVTGHAINQCKDLLLYRR